MVDTSFSALRFVALLNAVSLGWSDCLSEIALLVNSFKHLGELPVSSGPQYTHFSCGSKGCDCIFVLETSCESAVNI